MFPLLLLLFRYEAGDGLDNGDEAFFEEQQRRIAEAEELERQALAELAELKAMRIEEREQRIIAFEIKMNQMNKDRGNMIMKEVMRMRAEAQERWQDPDGMSIAERRQFQADLLKKESEGDCEAEQRARLLRDRMQMVLEDESMQATEAARRRRDQRIKDHRLRAHELKLRTGETLLMGLEDMASDARESANQIKARHATSVQVK